MDARDLRILHIYSSWTAGGAEKLMISLAQGLNSRGTVNAVACPRDSYLFERAVKSGVAAYPLVIKGSFDPFGIARLAAIVRAGRFNVLHAHQGKVFWPCIVMKKIFSRRIQVVFHRHAQIPHRPYSRWHYTLADHTIAISRAVETGLRESEKVPREKITVVYNGTDFTRFHPGISGETVRKKYGLEGKIVIGTVAAMNRPKGKGQGYLIEAARALRGKFPDVRYLIVGEGPIRSDLERRALELGVQDIVVFAGYQEEVEKYIAALDLFCFLSWDTEGFGQVMVEAQAQGKPVIGTDIGGIPETFRENGTGLLIPPRNTEALVSAIEELLKNPARRKAMGEAAAKFVPGAFGMDRMIDGVLAVYRS